MKNHLNLHISNFMKLENFYYMKKLYCYNYIAIPKSVLAQTTY